MNSILPATATGTEGASYSGFWRRVLATLIDTSIVQLFTQALIFVWSSLVSFALTNASAATSVALFVTSIFLLVLFTVAAGTLYFAFFESSKLRATPGKLFLQIYVTDINGMQLSLGRAIGRNIAKIVSFLPLCLGYLCIAFTARKQGLHDMIAKTVVRKELNAGLARILLAILVIFVLWGMLSVLTVISQKS